MKLKYSGAAQTLAILVVPFIFLLSYQLVMLLMPLTEAQQQTWDYLQSGDLNLPYGEDERTHLDDVRKVMRKVDTTIVIGVILVLLLLVTHQRDKTFLQKLALWGGIYTAVFAVLVLIGLLFLFEAMFTLFHTLFFPQGNWQFAADSLLIQAFPGTFFVTVALLIFGVSLLLALVLMWVGWCVTSVT